MQVIAAESEELGRGGARLRVGSLHVGFSPRRLLLDVQLPAVIVCRDEWRKCRGGDAMAVQEGASALPGDLAVKPSRLEVDEMLAVVGIAHPAAQDARISLMRVAAAGLDPGKSRS